jgi:hypothetical protein
MYRDIFQQKVIITMFGSSLPPVVCRRAHILFTLFVCLVFNTYCVVLCCCFIVLCCVVLCCVVLLFYFSPSCLPYVACFSGLSTFDCPFCILVLCLFIACCLNTNLFLFFRIKACWFNYGELNKLIQQTVIL